MTSFPSVARIARDAGLSERTVIRHLDHAEAAGWLTIERRVGEDGRRRTNRYELTIPNAHHAQDVRSANGGSHVQDLHMDQVTTNRLDHVTTATEPCDKDGKNQVTGCHPNPKPEPDSESEKEEPDARARVREAVQVAMRGDARKRAEGAGSAGGFQGESVADNVLLELAAEYVEAEGALEAWRAFELWAKRMEAKGKKVRSPDGAFVAFFRTWTKRRGGFGPEGVTLSRDMIRRARAGRRS